MADLIGKTLAGRYRIEAFLGKGGMAEVYKVWDKHRSVFLAMKVLYEDLALDNVFLRRFKREAQTLSQLEHPNIVRFYGLEKEGRMVYMLMDYVEGETLKHKIFDSNGPLPLPQVMDTMRQLCQALQYAHHEGFVHADIKPGNIMIDKIGKVLLSDFGIARMSESATVTMAGAGTPAYMAPEQCRGEMPTAQTDIYSLGIVLYEMLTGERPFTGERSSMTGSTGEKIRWEQLNVEPVSPHTYNKQVSAGIERIIMRCLAKAPAGRFEGISEFITALEMMEETEAGEKKGGEVDPNSHGKTVPAQPKKGLLASVWLLSLAVVILGAFVLVMNGKISTLSANQPVKISIKNEFTQPQYVVLNGTIFIQAPAKGTAFFYTKRGNYHFYLCHPTMIDNLSKCADWGTYDVNSDRVYLIGTK